MALAPLPIAVIVLCYNEAQQLAACLESVRAWAGELFVVDSFSTDGTPHIARAYTPHVFEHEFVNYSRQRNWALQHLPITCPWVMQLDADHRATPELAAALQARFAQGIAPEVNGFLVARRTVFMGRWIRHGGHYPVYQAAIFRHGKGFCEHRLYDQHFVVQGRTEVLKGDIIDVVTPSLAQFTERHSRWAMLEAQELLAQGPQGGQLQAKRGGNPQEHRRWLKAQYYRYPLFLRPFLYFFYRYVWKLGFLDGTEGLVFHCLQGWWFRFLVDAYVYEGRKQK